MLDRLLGAIFLVDSRECTRWCVLMGKQSPPPINGSPFFFEIHHPYTGNALHAGWPVYVVEALSIGLFSGGVCVVSFLHPDDP
jgi:hypothetical protein